MRYIKAAAAGGLALILLTACGVGVSRPAPTAAAADAWCTWWAPVSVPLAAAAAGPSGRVPARLGFRPDDPPFPPGLAPGTEVQVFGVSDRWVLGRVELASLTGAAGFVPLYLPRKA